MFVKNFPPAADRNNLLIHALIGSVLLHSLTVLLFRTELRPMTLAGPLPLFAEIRKVVITQKATPATGVLAISKTISQAKPQPRVVSVSPRQQETSSSPVIAAPPTVAAPSPTVTRAQVYTPPMFSAAYLDNPPPPYPLAARRRGVEGTVRIDVLVSREGHPRDTRLKVGSGAAELDESALTAVRHWRFAPALRDTEPVEAWVTVPIRFQLKDAGE